MVEGFSVSICSHTTYIDSYDMACLCKDYCIEQVSARNFSVNDSCEQINKFRNRLNWYSDKALYALIQYAKLFNYVFTSNRVKQIGIVIQREFDTYVLASLVDEKGNPIKEGDENGNLA
jgi:hypothetical protein